MDDKIRFKSETVANPYRVKLNTSKAVQRRSATAFERSTSNRASTINTYPVEGLRHDASR